MVLGLLWGAGAAGQGVDAPSDFQVYNLVKGDFIKDKLEGVLFSSPPLGYPSSKLGFAFDCGVWNGAVSMLGGLPSSASWLVKMITNEDETRTKTWTIPCIIM